MTRSRLQKTIKSHSTIIVNNPKYIIFTYGTLMRGFKRRDSLEKDPLVFIESLGDHRLQGYKLYANNNPESPIDYTIGELIEVNQYTMNLICGIERGYTPTPFNLNINGKINNFSIEDLLNIGAGESKLFNIVGFPFIVFLPTQKASKQNFNESTQMLKHSFRHFSNRTPIEKFKKILSKK